MHEYNIFHIIGENEMLWPKKRPKLFSYYHAQLRLSDKGHATNGWLSTIVGI